jgi:hypothetical protein
MTMVIKIVKIILLVQRRYYGWTEIHEIWYGCYDIGPYMKIILSNFLNFVISS